MLNTDYIDPKLLDETVKLSSLDYHNNKRLQVVAYDQATIYPGRDHEGGGLVDSSGRFISSSSTFDGMEGQEGAYKSGTIDYRDEEVVYLGMFFDVWGHCITDCLRHLWFFNDAKIDDKIKKLRFVWTASSWGDNFADNFWEMLSLLGFSQDRLERIVKPTKFRRIWMPDSSFHFQDSLKRDSLEYTAEYLDTINLLIARATDGAPISPNRSIYLSRTSWKWNDKDFGEKYIERVFQNMDFEIVHPQGLSFVEMVRLLQSVKRLASTEGSIAHNAIFLPQGAQTYIVRKRRGVIKYQPLIDCARSLETVYIDANLSHLQYCKEKLGHGPFFMYVNNRLARFAGIKSHFPVIDYLRYVITYFKHVASIKLRQLYR